MPTHYHHQLSATARVHQRVLSLNNIYSTIWNFSFIFSENIIQQEIKRVTQLVVVTSSMNEQQSINYIQYKQEEKWEMNEGKKITTFWIYQNNPVYIWNFVWTDRTLIVISIGPQLVLAPQSQTKNIKYLCKSQSTWPRRFFVLQHLCVCCVSYVLFSDSSVCTAYDLFVLREMTLTGVGCVPFRLGSQAATDDYYELRLLDSSLWGLNSWEDFVLFFFLFLFFFFCFSFLLVLANAPCKGGRQRRLVVVGIDGQHLRTQ